MYTGSQTINSTTQILKQQAYTEMNWHMRTYLQCLRNKFCITLGHFNSNHMHTSGANLRIRHILHNITIYLSYKYAGAGKVTGLLWSHAPAPLSFCFFASGRCHCPPPPPTGLWFPLWPSLHGPTELLVHGSTHCSLFSGRPYDLLLSIS
jgi:hypothetical protein